MNKEKKRDKQKNQLLSTGKKLVVARGEGGLGMSEIGNGE